MSSIQIYKENVQIITNNGNRVYYHDELGLANSVTSIISGGKSTEVVTEAMERGSLVHKVLELWLKSSQKGNKHLKIESKNLFNTLQTEEQTKVKAISELLDKSKLNLLSTAENAELSFIANDNNIKFGGTADLVCKDTIVDFKTGDYSSKYLEQLMAYATALGKEKICIIYFKSGVINHLFEDIKNLSTQYTNFKAKAAKLQEIELPIDRELAELELQYCDDYKLYEELKERLAATKIQMEQKISNYGLTYYKRNNATYFFKKGFDTKKLDKDHEAELYKEHPDWFLTVPTKPSFNVRINKGIKNETI